MVYIRMRAVTVPEGSSMNLRFFVNGARGAVLATGVILALGGTVYAATEGVPGIRSSANNSNPPPPPTLHVVAAFSRSVVHSDSRPHCTTFGYATTLGSKNTVSLVHDGRTVASHFLGWQKKGYHGYLWCVSKGHARGEFTARVFATNGQHSARSSDTVMVRK